MPVNTGRRTRVIASLIVLVMLSGCAPLATGSSQPGTRSPAFASEGHCVERHGLPDPRCTPGAVRAGVSLATICAFGYSPSVPHRRATPSR